MVDDSGGKRVGTLLTEAPSKAVPGSRWSKAGKRSGMPKHAARRLRKSFWRRRPRYFLLAYQSALMGVKLFHFSGRSSSAKMAVTGHTGTHAPQSLHSVGWM